MGRDLNKEVLNTVKKKTGNNISENAVKQLASTVTPTTMQNEAQLRQLIKQVSAMANVPVSENTINDIIQAIQSSGLNPNNLESLMKMMMKK